MSQKLCLSVSLSGWSYASKQRISKNSLTPQHLDRLWTPN